MIHVPNRIHGCLVYLAIHLQYKSTDYKCRWIYQAVPWILWGSQWATCHLNQAPVATASATTTTAIVEAPWKCRSVMDMCVFISTIPCRYEILSYTFGWFLVMFAYIWLTFNINICLIVNDVSLHFIDGHSLKPTSQISVPLAMETDISERK